MTVAFEMVDTRHVKMYFHLLCHKRTPQKQNNTTMAEYLASIFGTEKDK